MEAASWSPSLEVYLSKIEKELFAALPGFTRKRNLTKGEWLAMRSLADDRSIIIKQADKGSCVVVWDGNDYLVEGCRQLADEVIYKDVEGFQDDFRNVYIYIYIYDEKFVLKPYLGKLLSSPTRIESVSPDCRYGCFTTRLQALRRQV